jgi:hypothetical protein
VLYRVLCWSLKAFWLSMSLAESQTHPMAESHKLLDLPLSQPRDPRPESPRRRGKQALKLPRAAERESLQHRGTHKLARWLIVEESGGPDQLPNVPPIVSCKAKSRPKQLSPLSCERKSWHVPPSRTTHAIWPRKRDAPKPPSWCRRH